MKPLTPLELDALEARLQRPIPAAYRELLTHTGAGEHGDVQVYHPLEIEEAYQYHFEEPEELFNTYFPFGCNQRSQAFVWQTGGRPPSGTRRTPSPIPKNAGWTGRSGWPSMGGSCRPEPALLSGA